MCKAIGTTEESGRFIMPGWVCCRCAAKSSERAGTYNGEARVACKMCGEPHCVPITPEEHA